MKKIFISLVCLLVGYSAISQITVTADKVIAKASIYLKGRAIDSLSTDVTLGANADTVISSQKAIKTYITNYAQPLLIGTGFVKSTAGVITYDNSTYFSGFGTINTNSKNVNGATFTGNNIILQTADASFPGLITSAQFSFLDSAMRRLINDSVYFIKIGAGVRTFNVSGDTAYMSAFQSIYGNIITKLPDSSINIVADTGSTHGLVSKDYLAAHGGNSAIAATRVPFGSASSTLLVDSFLKYTAATHILYSDSIATAGLQTNYTYYPNIATATIVPPTGIKEWDSAGRLTVRTSLNKTYSISTSSIAANTSVIDTLLPASGNFLLSSTNPAGGTGYSDSTARQLLHAPKIFNVMDYGADSTGATPSDAAFQAAMNAAANAHGGTVYIPSGLFWLSTQSVTTSIGGMTNNNGIIYLPYSGSEATAYTITIQGEQGGSPGNMIAAPTGTTTTNKTGTRIYCTYAGSQSTTLGNIVVFGTGLVSGVLNFNTLVCKDLQIIMKNNPNGAGPEIGGISMKNAQGIMCYDISINVDTVPTTTTLPTRNVVGIETPDNNLGATYPILNCSVSCLRWGFVFGEHVSGDYLSAAMCFYGYGMKQGNHASHYGRIASFWSVNDIAYYYLQSGATPCVFNIEQIDIEHIAGLPGHWYSTHAFAVNDSLNLFQGSLNYEMVTSFVGQDNPSFTVNGAIGVSTLPISTPLWFSNTNGTTINSNSGFTTFTSANVYVKLNATSGTGQAAIVYTANGTNKWQEGMDFASNGTFDRYTYNIATAKLNAYYTPAGDVNFGFDALSSPTLKLQVTGGLAIKLLASAIPTGSSSDSILVFSGGSQVKAIAQSTLAVPWDATLSVNNTTAQEVIITGSPSTRPNMRIGDNMTATSINSSVQHILGNVVDSSGFKTITTGPGSGIVFVSGGFLFKTFATANAGSTPSNNQSFAGDSNWNVGIGGRITTLVEPLNTPLPGATATFGDNSVFFAAKAIPTGSTPDSVFVGTISSGVLQLKAVAQSSIVGATPTLQQVLMAGSTLTSANTILSGSNQLTFSGSTFLSQQNGTAAFGSIVSTSGAKSWTFGYITNNVSQSNGSALVVDSVNDLILQPGGGANAYTQFRGGIINNYAGKTGTYAVAGGDYFIDCTSNSFTVTLPTAVGRGGQTYIIKNSGTATTITIATTSSQTIDGSAPTPLTTAVPLRVISDGSNWKSF